MAVKKKRGETKEMEAEKILVVDDNKEIVYSISELLKYEGYEILKAYHGAGECRPDPSGCDDAKTQWSVSADETA